MLLSLRKFNDLGHRALLAGDDATLTVGSEPSTGYLKEKLLTDHLADWWQALGNGTSQTWVSAALVAPTIPFNLKIAGLLGTNRDLGSTRYNDPDLINQWRLRADRYPLADRIRPEIVSVSLTNLTGAEADIAGPLEPPLNPPISYAPTRLEAVSLSTNTQVIVTFADHTTAERDLSPTEGQIFRIHTADSTTVATVPILTTTLRHAGADVGSALVPDRIEKTTEGYIYHYLVTAGSLPAFTGAFGLKILGTTTGTSTPEFLAVEWVAELITTGDAAILFDSDWIEISTGDNLAYVFDPPLLIASSVETRYLHFEFSRLGRSVFVGTSGSTPIIQYTEILSEFRAGRLVIAESLSADLASPDGFNLSESSNEFGLQRTEADLTVQALPYATIFDDLATFRNAVGVLSNQPSSRGGAIRGRGVVPFLLIPFEDDLTSMMWVVLTSWETPSVGWWTGDGDSGERWDLTFSVMEAQAKRVGTG